MKLRFTHPLAIGMLISITSHSFGMHKPYQSAAVRAQQTKEVYLDPVRTKVTHVDDYKEKFSYKLGDLAFINDFYFFTTIYSEKIKKFFNLGASVNPTAKLYYVFKSGKKFEETHIQRTTLPINATGKNSLIVPFDCLDIRSNKTIAEYKTYPAVLEFINKAHAQCKQDPACKAFTVGIIADLKKKEATLVDISK